MSGVAPNGHAHTHGLDLVPLRPLVEEAIDIRFALSPGDRVIAEEGSAVTVGDPLAERFRDTVRRKVALGGRGAHARHIEVDLVRITT